MFETMLTIRQRYPKDHADYAMKYMDKQFGEALMEFISEHGTCIVGPIRREDFPVRYQSGSYPLVDEVEVVISANIELLDEPKDWSRSPIYMPVKKRWFR
jgi:hypothetical protein